MNEKIQTLIKQAANSVKKEIDKKIPTNVGESSSNLLSGLNSRLERIIEQNIQSGGIKIGGIDHFDHPKHTPINIQKLVKDSDNNPDFIKNRMDEIIKASNDLSEEIRKSQESIAQKRNVTENDENTNNPAQASSETENTDTPIQNMEGVRLLSKSKVRVLADELLTKVFGQNDVIFDIVTTLKSAALNIKINKEKPAGCYLFAGPSGVGKTELAVSLAEKLGVPILKLNMGEYSLEQDITKLIGTAKGYVGYKEGGLLTNFVRDNPACIILFDELEKAHSSIDKPLLSIMDHGICTDNKGQDISFKETIVISTSNLGAEVEYYGDQMTKKEKDAYRMDVIKKNLRPEIINRYDSVFHFNSLTPEIYALVSQKFLKKLQENMLEEHNYKLSFSQKLIDFIVEKSYDPAMGGRPARRFIEQVVIEPLVNRMLDDDFEDIVVEHPTITMDINKNGNIFFRGTNRKVLGTQENTGEIVARMEEGKFTQKQEIDFPEDVSAEPVSVLPKAGI